MFLKPEKLQNHSNEGKGKEKKKERGEGKEEKKKSNGYTLSFYNSYFGDFLAEINCWTQIKGLFGDNVVKNPARCTSQALNQSSQTTKMNDTLKNPQFQSDFIFFKIVHLCLLLHFWC